MKKLLLNMQYTARKVSVVTIFLLLSAQLASAQNADTLASHPSTPMYDIYMQRYKTGKTVAWVFLSTGVAAAIVGYFDARSSGPFFSGRFDTGIGLMFIGGLVVIPSIPLFIMAGRNKRKAMLHLKTGTITEPGGFNYAAVGLKLNL